MHASPVPGHDRRQTVARRQMGWHPLPSPDRRKSLLQSTKNSRRCLPEGWCDLLHATVQRTSRPCRTDCRLPISTNSPEAQVIPVLPPCRFRHCTDCRGRPAGSRPGDNLRHRGLLHGGPFTHSKPVLHLAITPVHNHHDYVCILPFHRRTGQQS